MVAKKSNEWTYTVWAYMLLGLTIVSLITFAYYNSLPQDGMPAAESISFYRRLTVVIPEIFILILAAVGAISLKKYSVNIKGSPDARGLSLIADALLLIVLYLIVLLNANNVVGILRDTSYLHEAIFVKNHLPILIALKAAILLHSGTKRLAALVPARFWTWQSIAAVSLPVWLALITFVWTFYTALPGLRPVNGVPLFVVSSEALMFTYVLPHMIFLVLGVLSVINMSHYARLAPGSVYRSLFSTLAIGIMLVFSSIILAQFIMVSSFTLHKFNFGSFMIYGVLMSALVGFCLIMKGVKRLEKIELVLT